MNSFKRTGIALAMAVGLAAATARATPLYWDSNTGATAGAGATPTGIWGTSSFWNSDPTGGGAGAFQSATANSDDLYIVAGPGAASGNNAFVITVSTTRAAKSLTFQASGATTVSGGTSITLGDGAVGGITMGQYAYGATAQGAVTISTPVILNAAQTWQNNAASVLKVGGGLNLNGNALTFGGSGNINFDITGSVITGSGGIIKDGTGALVLDSNPTVTHTFTGGITVNGGRVAYQTSANVTGRGNVTLNGGYLAGRYGSPATFADLGTGSTHIRIIGGTSGFSGEGTSGSQFQIGGAGSTLIWGALGEGAATGYFNPSVLLLGGAGANANGVGSLNNAINLNGTTRTITSTHPSDSAATSGFSVLGAISGSAGLIKTGGGNIILSGNNIFNGGLTISAGRVTLGHNNALGTGTLTFNGGNIDVSAARTTANNNAQNWNADFTFLGANTLDLGTGAVTMNANRIVTVGASTLTVGGIIGDGSSGYSLTKAGAGTLILTGTSSYTGPTTISAGTLTLNSPGSLAAGSTVNFDGGALTGTGTINGPLNVGVGRTLSTTTLTYNGMVTGAAGAANISPAGFGTLGTLALGAGLTLNAGNAVECDLGTTSGSSDVVAITGNLVLNGTAYVAFNVPTGSAAANATYTVMTWTGSQTGGGTLVFPNGTTTMNGATLNINANSVTITTGGGGITTAGRNVTWFGTSSYVWDSSTVNWKEGSTPTAYAYGDNVTFDDSGVAASPITGLPANPGSVTVSSTSAKNYTISAPFGGSGGLSKSGNSTLTLTGANIYSGGTMINSGTISINGNNALGANGTAVTFNGSGGLTMTAEMTFDHPVALNNNAVLTVNSTGNPTLSGAITGNGAINWVTGSGSPSLSSPNNTFTGNLTLPTANGTLLLGFASIGDAGLISFRKSGYRANVTYTGSANLVLNNRRIDLTSSFGGVGDGMGYPINMFENNGAGVVIFNANMNVASGRTGTFFFGGTNKGDNTYAGLIPNSTGGTLSISTYGTAKWILANDNTFAGKAITGGGILSAGKITVAGAAQPLGVGSIIQLGYQGSSGNLEFTGSSNNTTDKQVQIGDTATNQGGAGGIIINGSGTLTFSAATFNIAMTGITASRTLTLGGSNAGDNTIAGTIQNNATGGLVNLSKTGIGKWTIAGANTFTGTTTLSGGGTLVLDYATQNNSKLADAAALTVSITSGGGGGTLILSGGSHTELLGSTTTLNNGTGLWITRTSGSSKLQLNAISRPNGQAAISFSEDSIASTDTANVNGILGCWATVGSNWAVNSTGGADGAIVGLTTYETTFPTATGDATKNYQLTGGQTQTGDTTGNSLRLVNGANSDTLALGIRALTPGANHNAGILYVGGFDNNYTITGSTPGAIKSATPNNNLAVNVFTGTLTVNALLNAGSAATLKYGVGTLVIGGNNTSSGALYVLDGTARLTHNNAAGTTAGGITVQNGAALELANGITIGAEAQTIVGTGRSNGGALRNIASNTSTYGGTITIGAGGARINSDSGATLTINNASAVVTALFQDVTFGGAGNTTVSGAISGAGNVIKDGTGTLTLSGPNTYTGETLVNEGTLKITTATAIPNGGIVRVATGAKLDLADGVDEVIGTLYLNGQAAAAGTWGSKSSGADNQDNTFFSGTGKVTVSTTGSGTPYVIPGPTGTIIMLK